MSDWWRTVREGDVLKWPHGSMRVIRKLSHPDSLNPRRKYCYFSIRHCSWTGRCYTLYSIGELMGMGVIPTGVRIHFKHPLDLKINRVIQRGGDREEMSCCAVSGVR
jgi:hypothetical protein